MRLSEIKIISWMSKYPYYPVAEHVHALCDIPLGQLSVDFCNNPCVERYRENSQILNLRLALEEYAIQPSEEALRTIEKILKKLPSPLLGRARGDFHGLHDKAAGTYLLPISNTLIHHVYMLDDPALTGLFQKEFPTPFIQLFAGTQIPSVIRTQTDMINETMRKVALKTLEPFMLKVQRLTRIKKRYQEELNRISLIDRAYLESSQQSAEALIQDANTPYIPKCAANLSARIVAAAKHVSAFSTVKHITSQSALKSIFDNALYGRRTLMNFYLLFNPAALGIEDVLNGDGNVVCLGPQDIDPLASGDIVMEFDLSKLTQKKTPAFYKQRDLVYSPELNVRRVALGGAELFFDHTSRGTSQDQTKTELRIFDDQEGSIVNRSASIKKSSFIAYDMEHMHEILTLNFFRFIDEMTHVNGRRDQAYIDSFYEKVDQLTDAALLIFLTSLEKNMTDTAEFNFYGAHQIDFSTVINISDQSQGYTIHFPSFIYNLSRGHLAELRLARNKIPELFQSYRFLDYLLQQVRYSDARYYLDDLRKQCQTPEWVRYTPLVLPEGFEVCWDLSSDMSEQEIVGFRVPK